MEKFLIEHCSPTLASLKTANLFNYKYTDEGELYGYLRDLINVNTCTDSYLRKAEEASSS